MTTRKNLTNVTVKDAEKGTVEAVFSTFGVRDLDGDVVQKGAIPDGAPVIISSYGHTSWDGELPIGSGTIRTTDTEAILDGKFFMDTTHGRDAFATIKAVSEAGLQEWSYSLEDVVAKRGELDGVPVRFIESVKVKEVSPVLRGASINTRTLAVKHADLKFSEHADAVLTEVDALVARATEVVTLRATQGKKLGAESAEQLTRLGDVLEQLKALLVEPDPEPTLDDELTRLYLRSVANIQGVTTS